MMRALILVVLASVLILGSEACTCADQGDHFRYCKAGFVAVLRITSPALHPASGKPLQQWLDEQEAENGLSQRYYDDVKYAFELTETKPLRDDDKILDGAKFIYSAADDGLCGYSFNEGEYVVFGYYSTYKKQLRTGSCSGNFQLREDTPENIQRYDALTKYSCEGEIPDLSQLKIMRRPALVTADSEKK